MEAKKVPIIIINGLLALLLLYYASIQVPFAGLMIGALLPLPIILVICRAGWIAGFLQVGAGVGILHYVEHFFGLKAEVLPFMHMAFIAFVMSFLASRRYRLEVIVGGTVMAAALVQASVFLVQAWQQQQTPLTYLQHTVQEVWTSLMQLVEKEKILEQELSLPGLSVAELSTVIAQITPALVLINNTVVVLLNYILSRQCGGQHGWEESKLPLPCWEVPGPLIFVLIGAGFFLLVPYQAVHLTGINVLLFCGLLYFFQGLAILAFSFRRFQVPQFFRWTVYMLLILVKPAIILVILMGLTDLWFDFRRLHQPPPEV